LNCQVWVSRVFSLISVTHAGHQHGLAAQQVHQLAHGQLDDSKYLASGQTRTVVPCLRSPPAAHHQRLDHIAAREGQRGHLAVAVLHLQRVASALVTDTPTPCRPPEKL
jgi:hypothetical protein